MVKKLNFEESKHFFEYVKAFFCKSCDYIIQKFPVSSDILDYAKVWDISKRGEVKFSSIFFLEKFSLLLRDSKSAFEAESLRYQMAVLPENIISQERPDSQWSKLSKLKDNEGK